MRRDAPKLVLIRSLRDTIIEHFHPGIGVTTGNSPIGGRVPPRGVSSIRRVRSPGLQLRFWNLVTGHWKLRL
jgi:hypothetical protein